jgi:hypothetical protein
MTAFKIHLPALLLAAGLAACGSSTAPDRATVASPVLPPPSGIVLDAKGCPAGGDLTTAAAILPGLLPSDDQLSAWQRYMVGLGPRFDGSPALKSFHDFLAAQLAASGLTVKREPITFDWWLHKHWSLKLIEADGTETTIPAPAYFPYSGFTPEGGITAELADAGSGLPTDFAAGNFTGKIAFFSVDVPPLKLGVFYANASYIHDPDQTFSPTTDYKRAWTYIVSPQLSVITPQQTTSLSFAKTAGAIGAIVSFDGSPANTEGQYLPFENTDPGNSPAVPTLFVDRATGDQLKAKIATGAKVRLELVVEQHPKDSSDDIVATLPGTNPDEFLIVNSHTDGTSDAEENGGLGVIALARYFAALPASCRQRTMVFALTPGHFYGSGMGGDTGRFITRHPEIIAKAVGSLTIEHLGQTEWLDDSTGFHPTGQYEAGVFFGSATPIQLLMKNAVVAEDLRRVLVSRPIGAIYFGVGSNLNSAGVPNAAYITGPNSLASFAQNQHLDQFDVRRMAAEIRTATRIAASMDATATTTLCAGMTPSQSGGSTGCSSVPAPSSALLQSRSFRSTTPRS